MFLVEELQSKQLGNLQCLYLYADLVIYLPDVRIKSHGFLSLVIAKTDSRWSDMQIS